MFSMIRLNQRQHQWAKDKKNFYIHVFLNLSVEICVWIIKTEIIINQEANKKNAR